MIPLFVISAAGADTIPSQTGFGRPTHWLGPLPTPQPNATPMDSESCPEKKTRSRHAFPILPVSVLIPYTCVHRIPTAP